MDIRDITDMQPVYEAYISLRSDDSEVDIQITDDYKILVEVHAYESD